MKPGRTKTSKGAIKLSARPHNPRPDDTGSPPPKGPIDFAETEHERLLAALKVSRTGTWRWNIAADIVEWDDALCDVYGIKREQAPRNSQEFLSLVHPDDRPAVWRAISTCLEKGGDADFQFRAVVGETVRWIYDRSGLIRDANGTPTHLIGACLDMTERRRVEQERDALLERQTILLRELIHRTKNHLTMVTAMLQLKAARQKDPGAKQDFERAIERIHTLVFLHERLYHRDTFDRVNMQTYLEDICTSLEQSLLTETNISLDRELQGAELHVDQAVPIGLIVNEVVTNAAKYAFAPNLDGRILIRFNRFAGAASLTISDNGRGLSISRVGRGVGIKLIKSLAQQIGARLRMISRNGLTYSLRFRTQDRRILERHQN